MNARFGQVKPLRYVGSHLEIWVVIVSRKRPVKIFLAIEDSQQCFSVAVGSRRLLVLPFWVPFWELEVYLIARS